MAKRRERRQPLANLVCWAGGHQPHNRQRQFRKNRATGSNDESALKLGDPVNGDRQSPSSTPTTMILWLS
jgi:hypothetical protein